MIKKRLLAPVLIMLMLCMLSGCFFSLPLDHMDKIEGDITCAFRAGEDASHWQEAVNTDAVFDKDRFVELFNEFNKYDPAFYKDHLDKLDLRIVREDQFDEYEEMAASEVNFMAYFTDKNGNDMKVESHTREEIEKLAEIDLNYHEDDPKPFQEPVKNE